LHLPAEHGRVGEMENKVFAELTELVSLPIAFGCGAPPNLQVTTQPQNKTDVYVILLMYQGGIIITKTSSFVGP